jgi:hypothetical protein
MKKISILLFVIAVLSTTTLSAQKKVQKKSVRVGFTKQINGEYPIIKQDELVRALETNNTYLFTAPPKVIIDGCARAWQVPRDSVLVRLRRAIIVPYNSRVHHVTNTDYNLTTGQVEFSNTPIPEGTPMYMDPLDSLCLMKVNCTNPLHDEFLGTKRARFEARKYDPNEYEVVIDIRDSVATFGTKEIIYDTKYVTIPCGQCPATTCASTQFVPQMYPSMYPSYSYSQQGYTFGIGFGMNFGNAGLYGQSYGYDLWSRPFQWNPSQGNWSTTNNVYNTTYNNTTWASNNNPGTTYVPPSTTGLTNPWRPAPDNNARPNCNGSTGRPNSGGGLRPHP